jgi:hypothetical protein
MSFRPLNTGTPATNEIHCRRSRAAVWAASSRATIKPGRTLCSANMHTSQLRSMRLPFANNVDPNSWASRMRRARLAQFMALLPKGDTSTQILDVGGTEKFWMSVWNEQCEHLSITLLNLSAAPVSGHLPVRSVAGDARELSEFGALEFDLCFSNSVIEHVGTLGDQRRMAEEIRRVARGYFVQTPYRYFPLEPHFHVPGWAQLPLWCRTALHQRMDLGWFSAEPDYIKARVDVEQIRLLSKREFCALFGDAEIRLEKVGPLIKSMIAVRPLEHRSDPLVSAAGAY